MNGAGRPVPGLLSLGYYLWVYGYFIGFLGIFFIHNPRTDWGNCIFDNGWFL